MGNTENKPEYWQSGPVPGVPVLLQPVAHAILQARDEVVAITQNFPGELLWLRPAGMASVGFHLQHLTGVLDRLFTYARNEPLSEIQLQSLKSENDNSPKEISPAFLLAEFIEQVNRSVHQLKHTDISTLTDARGIGRKQIPTNVIGLLFHAAEHTMRHTGQLLVTAAFLKTQAADSA